MKVRDAPQMKRLSRTGKWAVVLLVLAAGALIAWQGLSRLIVGRRPANETMVNTSRARPESPTAPLPRPLTHPEITVFKGDRRLLLYSGGEVVRVYRIGLGTHPTGDKEREGDGRTPEGQFYVCTKNPESNFYLSLGLSYPNEEDAERGLRDGLITQPQHDQIQRAIRRGRQPPWNTALGGEICIHGRGSKTDWTLGCIALDDQDVRELYHAVPLGTAVSIHP